MKLRTCLVSILSTGLMAVAIGHGAVHAQGRGTDERVDVLIAYRQAPTAEDVADVRRRGGEVKRTFHLVPAIAARVPAGALAGLQNNQKVRTIEPNGQFQAHDLEGNNTWGVVKIGAQTVQTNGNTGVNVRVAVIDTGVNCSHAELTGHCGGGFDFVNNDSDPSDDNSHGTHVAGTIAAGANAFGVVGVAPNAQVVPLKVLDDKGSGDFDDVIAALEWIVDYNAAHPGSPILVTNSSYGSSGNPGSTVQAAFDEAYAAGIVNIASAGNSGICSGATNTVGYPGRYTSVLAVAATDVNNARSCWSSTGPDVDIAAPGVSINSTYYTGGYAVFSGTSMASPHVAGVAALVVAANPANSDGVNGVADEVRNAITSTALDLGTAGKDNLYGYGLVQAVAAVAAAVNQPPPPPSGTSKVSSIGYATNGGKGGTKNLVVTLTVKDQNNANLSGASVSITIKRGTATYGTASGTTGANGQVSFTASNAPVGTYTTLVNSVTKSGYTWDGVTPGNTFTK
jgi:subtilisin